MRTRRRRVSEFHSDTLYDVIEVGGKMTSYLNVSRQFQITTPGDLSEPKVIALFWARKEQVRLSLKSLVQNIDDIY